MFVAVGVADGVVESSLELEGVVELLQLGQDDDEAEDDEEHDQELPRVVVGGDVSIAHGAEGDQHKPDGVKEIEVTVDQLHTMKETYPEERGGVIMEHCCSYF